MKTFRDLLIWQKSMILVTNTYQITKNFPKEEIYGLTSQIRRCSISVPSNIAEGFGRQSKIEFVRFLNISMSSLFEYQTQIEIAKNINYLSELDFEQLYQKTRELEAMMASYIRKINVSFVQQPRN
jgi:four helix bundle protein